MPTEKNKQIYDKVKISRSDFVRLCPDFEEEEFPQYEVKADGIYLNEDECNDIKKHCLFTEEFLQIRRHPGDDETEPLLKFPCTVDALEVFIKWLGVGSFYGQEDLDNVCKQYMKKHESIEDFAERMKQQNKSREELAVLILKRDPQMTHFHLGKLITMPGESTKEKGTLVQRSLRARKKAIKLGLYKAPSKASKKAKK